jgi:hypothetical protein
MADHRLVNAASDSCHIGEIKGSLIDENSGGGCMQPAINAIIREDNPMPILSMIDKPREGDGFCSNHEFV